MYPMNGVPKPFSDTYHGHGNIPLTVEGCPDLARRLVPKFQNSESILRKIINNKVEIPHNGPSAVMVE